MEQKAIMNSSSEEQEQLKRLESAANKYRRDDKKDDKSQQSLALNLDSNNEKLEFLKEIKKASIEQLKKRLNEVQAELKRKTEQVEQKMGGYYWINNSIPGLKKKNRGYNYNFRR